MTARQNMGFGLKTRGNDPENIDRWVREVASLLDSTSLLNRYPKGMSGGERQRVALGHAMVRKPQVFLLIAVMKGGSVFQVGSPE